MYQGACKKLIFLILDTMGGVGGGPFIKRLEILKIYSYSSAGN